MHLPSTRYLLLTLSFALLTFFAAGPATAQGGASAISAQAAAEGLFEEAHRAAEAGDLATACAKLEASEALDPAVGTLLHLADCYERSGKLASAWARFREAQSLSDAQGMRERALIAQARATSLEPRLSRLVVQVASPAPDLQLRIGGTVVPRGTWGSALPFDPGVVTIGATAPGYTDFSRTITVPADEAALLRVEVPALRRAPQSAVSERQAPPPPAAKRGGTQRSIGIATAALGAVGLVAGATFGVVAHRKNEDSLSHCSVSDTVCSARGVELREQAATWADAATISAAVGGALAITGVALFFTAPDGGAERRTVAVGANVLGDSFLLSARGSY